MDRVDVQTWVATYERLWRSPGTDLLGELFTPDTSYRPSPWSPTVEGVPELSRFWETERAGPDEAFSMHSDVVAVEGQTAVVRVSVEYGDGTRWRDLWVVVLDEDGRCSSFEEWPFAPDQHDGH